MYIEKVADEHYKTQPRLFIRNSNISPILTKCHLPDKMSCSVLYFCVLSLHVRPDDTSYLCIHLLIDKLLLTVTAAPSQQSISILNKAYCIYWYNNSRVGQNLVEKLLRLKQRSICFKRLAESSFCKHFYHQGTERHERKSSLLYLCYSCHCWWLRSTLSTELNVTTWPTCGENKMHCEGAKQQNATECLLFNVGQKNDYILCTSSLQRKQFDIHMGFI